MSYLSELRAQKPALKEYSDDEIIDYLPTYDPARFSGLDSDQVRQAATNESWEITKGIKSGVDQTQALGYGLLGAAADALGADSARDWAVKGYQEQMTEARVNAGDTQNFSDIDDAGAALEWAGYTIGNLVPTMATAIAGGGLGGILAKQGAKKVAADLIKDQLAKGVAKEQAVKHAGEFIARRVATGQGLGAYAASTGMETGSIYGETGDAGVSLAHGAVAGAFDALPVTRVLNKFGLAGAAKEQVTRSVTGEILKQGGLEAGTEGLQTLVEQHAKHWVDTNGDSLLGNLGEANWAEIANAAAAGALGGGVMGGGAGVLTRRPMDNANEKIKQAGEQAAEAGGDALDQEIAKARTAVDEIPKANAATNDLDEALTAATQKINPADYQSPAMEREQSTERGFEGLDGLITLADRMPGGLEDAARLRKAKDLFQKADSARSAGNDAMASMYVRQGNKLYQAATETNEVLREQRVNFPVPYVAQGEIEGGELTPSPGTPPRGETFDQPRTVGGTRAIGQRPTDRLGQSGIIYGEEPADVRAGREQRAADDFSARYGQEGATPYQRPAIEGELDRSTELPPGRRPAQLPPGTGQMDMGQDRPERVFTPVQAAYEGVGRNVVERQAQTATALPQGSAVRAITPENFRQMQVLRNQGLRTKLRDRTQEQAEAIQITEAVKAGEVVVSTESENIDTSSERVQATDIPTPKTVEDIEGLALHSIYTMVGRDGILRYMVRGEGKRGGGDTIHATLDDARDYVTISRRQEADTQARAARAQEAARAESDAEQVLVDSYGGFLDSSPMASGRQRSTLEKQISHNGRPKTRKQMIEDLVDEGYSPISVEVTDTAALNRATSERDRLARKAPLGNEQHPDTKRLRELDSQISQGFKKTVLRMQGPDGSFFDEKALTKTGIQYAEHLQSKQQSTTRQPTQPSQSEAADPHAYPFDEAVRAYSHTSRSPRQAAKVRQQQYERAVAEARKNGAALAKTDAQREALDAAMDQFRADYLRHELSALQDREATVSSHIAGRSNFNIRQANRRSSALDRAEDALVTAINRGKDKVEQSVLAARTETQRATDRADQQTKANKSQLTRHIKDIISTIGAMAQPGFDKAAFRPRLAKAFTAALALDRTKTLAAMAAADTGFSDLGGLGKVIGTRSQIWKDYQAALAEVPAEAFPVAAQAAVNQANEKEASAPRRERGQRNLYEQKLESITDIDEARQYIDDLRTTLMRDERTGLGSNHAWVNRAPKPFVASIDLDSLKWVNDNMSHQKGDEMIAMMGDAMREAGISEDAYHISGDEFNVQSDTEQQLKDGLARAQKWMSKQTIESGDISIKGPGFSYGIAETVEGADAKLKDHKAQREEEGARAPRGETPIGQETRYSRWKAAHVVTGGKAADSTDRQTEIGADSGRVTTSIPIEEIKRRTTETVSQWKNSPDVVVVGNESELPSELKNIIEQDDASGQIDGVFHKGKVYVIADNIRNKSDLDRVLMHEALGHYGLRELYGPQIVTQLDILWNRIGGLEGIKRLQKEHGFSLNVYWDSAADWSKDQRQRMMVDELIAHIAGAGKVEPKLIQRIAHLIRQGLRKLFGDTRFAPTLDQMTDIELLNIVAAARQSVTEGGNGAVYANHNPVFSDKFERVVAARSAGDGGGSFDPNNPDIRYSRTDSGDLTAPKEAATGKPMRVHFARNTVSSRGGAPAGMDFGQSIEPAGEYMVIQDSDMSSLGSDGWVYGVIEFSNPLVLEHKSTGSTGWKKDLSEMFGGKTGKPLATAVKRAGYDGIITRDKYDYSETVNLAGEKSSSQDTRYSRTDSTNFAMPDETLVKVAMRKMADKFQVLKDLQKSIEQAGGTVSDEANAYRAEELFHGKAEEDLRQMRESLVKPLAEKMAKFGISQEELDQYLYAKHAPERNAHIAEINPDMTDGGSGMTNAEAEAIVDQVTQSGKQAEYDQLSKIVYDMLATRRETIRGAGLEGGEMVDAWESSYQNYVPLKGWAENEQQAGMPRAGKGFNIGGKESKRAMGRSSEAASPSTQAIQDLTETLIRKRKNEVGQSFLKLVEENPNPDYWQVFTDENPEMDRRIIKRKDPETGETVEEVREQPIPMAMMSDRYFQTKRDGKTYFIKLEDPRLMKAMKNIGPDTSNFLIRTLGGINRILSSLNTSYNPEFVVGNFARDIQTAVLNLSAEQTRGDGKIQGEKIVKQTIKDVPKAMRAVYRSLRGKAPKNEEWAKWFDEFREAGAKTGYFDMKDIDGQAKEIQNLINMANGGFKGTAMKWSESAGTIVEDINNSVENAVRLSAYVNARKAGVGKDQAASLAKNMTVNFNRRGEAGTTLNALYMFANASIQGSMNFGRTMIGLKGRKGDKLWSRLNTAQKISVGMMGGAVALGAANRMAAGDDEDGENWYSKVPDYVKERNIVIMKSLLGGEQDGTYWKIPLPYGYNIFHVFGTSVEAVTNGGENIGEAMSDLTLAALGSFSPIGFQDSQSGVGAILKNVTPTLGKPIVDVALNENFMGSSIYNENFPFGTPKPDSSLSRRSTPAGYKAVAEFLNDVSGGSQWRSGAVDINPDVMRYFVDYFLGGSGKFVLSKLPDNAYNLATGVEMEPHRAIFLSRVSGKVLPYEDQSKFYDRRDEIGQINEEFEALQGQERVEFYRGNRKLLALRPLIKSTEKQLKIFRKQRDAIYAKDLPPVEQDRQLKDVEGRMKQVVDRFNKSYSSAID